MPDHAPSLPESVSRLAKFYTEQKLRHLANPKYSGLEKVQTDKDFDVWKKGKEANGIIVPITVWHDFEDAEKFAELAETSTHNLAQEANHEKDEKHAKHESYGPVHKNNDEELREKYRKIIDIERQEIESSTGQKFDGNTFISDTMLNPKIREEHMPNYHASALEKFKQKYGEEEYKKLLDLEERTIYRNEKNELVPEADPAYRETNKTIDKKFNELVAKHDSEVEKNAKSTYAYSVRKLDKDKLKKQLTLQEMVEFVKKYPEKAAVYAQKDPKLLKAISIVAATEKALLNKTFTSDVERSQAEQVFIIQTIEAEVEQVYEEPVFYSIPEQSDPGDNYSTPPSTPPSAQPSSGVPYSNPLPGPSASPGSSASPGGAPPQPRQRGSAPANFLRNRFGPKLPGMPSAGAGGGGAEEVAAQVQNFIPPQAKIIIFIILGLLLFLALLLVADNQIPPDQTDTDQPITITKKTTDINVQPGQPISYTINVSYPGTASDIVITDPIPDGSEFVDASGVKECDPNPCGKTTKTITWRASAQSGTKQPNQTSSGGPQFDQAKFEKMGFPAPSNPDPVVLDTKGLERWKSGAMQAAIKASSATGVDVGIIGFWSFYEGINYDATYDNCNKEGSEGPAGDSDMNTPCGYTNWQVGNGIRPAEQVSTLDGAFKAMYGSSDTAMVQKVGQAVIDKIAANYSTKINYPSTTFPNSSLQSLRDGMGDPATRTWVGHLTRDDAISMYILATIFQGSTASDPSNFANSLLYDSPLCGTNCFYDKQRIIDTIKALYDAGLSGGGSSFPSMEFTLKVRPLSTGYVVNTAYAQVNK